MKKIDLEQQYQDYLQRVKLQENKMPKQQRIETKRAFMAGISQAFVLLTEDVAELPEEKAMVAITEMNRQIGRYWREQRENESH